MLARLAFYPSLLYNVAMERLSSRTWYNRIDETVILGALPFRSMTKQLVEDENVRGVITMNEEFETRHFVNNTQEWNAVGVSHLLLPVPDLLEAPSQEQLQEGVDFIQDFRMKGRGSVYVHCKAGRTRSATVVASYLMQRHQWSPEEAVAFLKEKRPHVSIRQPQRKALHKFCTDKKINEEQGKS